MRFIVPYTPGGVSDITARVMAEPLAAAWGQPVPVENRAGADGVIGTEALAKSQPDGHTLGLVSVGHPVNAAYYRLPYDTMRDFSFVTQTTSTPLVLCAGARLRRLDAGRAGGARQAQPRRHLRRHRRRGAARAGALRAARRRSS